MSICRFFWDASDIYIYGGEEGWVCCGCALYDGYWLCDYEEEERMVGHLEEHVEAGHVVLPHVFDAFNGEHPHPEPAIEARDAWREEHYQEYGYMWDDDHPLWLTAEDADG